MKNGVQNLCTFKTHLTIKVGFTNKNWQKCIGMGTITLYLCQALQKVKYFVWYIIFKISKISTILSVCQPASQLAIRPGSTSATAPVFLFTQE